jgi:rRNA maturation protein Nop10
MKVRILHRVVFSHKDNVDAELQRARVKYTQTPSSERGGYIIAFNIYEDEPGWSKVIELIEQKESTFNVWDTIFTPEEILAADWVRLMTFFEKGLHAPESGWDTLYYEDKCPQCGVGYRQVAPFHFSKEPRMGKQQFLQLYGATELFCTLDVVEAMRANDLRGYELWDAIIHKTGQPSQIVHQLYFPTVAAPALAEENKQLPYACPVCGQVKYGYHKRGYMRLKRDALAKDVDFQLTHEWFGTGGWTAYREKLISHRMAKLIIDNGWRGVRLKPVELY